MTSSEGSTIPRALVEEWRRRADAWLALACTPDPRLSERQKEHVRLFEASFTRTLRRRA